jgi:hypothetical protein
VTVRVNDWVLTALFIALLISSSIVGVLLT